MDTSIPTIESVLNFAGRWPALLSIVLGGFAAWAVALVVERYFMPTAHDPDTLRHQKGATFVLNWLLGGVFSSLVWHALVVGVPVRVTLAVSFVVGAVTAFVYPILARLATAKWPAIGSAWSPRD